MTAGAWHWDEECRTTKNIQTLTTCHTWTNSVDGRRQSPSHASSGDDPEHVGQLGIEVKDVGTPGVARFGRDGVEAVSRLGTSTIPAQEGWSFHLDVKPFAKAHEVLCHIASKWSQSRVLPQ